ncbi:MAG TPA: DUF488 domain-containing protein [Verrucomicrobiae bacterium]|jgi:uncharacterized protein (DUF488 family)
MGALTIWTIGHSNRTLEQFLELLESQRIQLLADVRRFPGSRRLPHFNQENLSKSLADAGIEYVHFPELGGRRKAFANSPNNAWRNEAFRGYADFMMTEEFRAGINRLLELARSKRTAIMCAEALWWQCHRSLIADYLKASGHEVIHIMGANKTDEHPFTSAARIVDGKLSYGAESEPQFLF